MSVKWPVRFPVAVGLKVTLMAHVLCAARLAPQVLVSAKSPVTDIPVIFTGASPALLTFKVLAELVAPTL